MKNLKIVLTGGGTAGHVMPNISLMQYLKKTFSSVHYIGSNEGIENKIVNNYNEQNKEQIKMHNITTVKLRRSLNLKNLLIPFKLLSGTAQAKKILKQIKPNVIFSKGGFVSVPVILAAKSLKIPIVSHESDLTLGLANKLTVKKVNVLCTTFQKTAKNHKNAICTGSPIRSQILEGKKEIVFARHNIDKTLPTVLVTGGSMGAVSLNNVFFNNAEILTKKYNIIHITGKNNANTSINIKNYIQLEFVQDIEHYFAAADVVVSRAGSNAIFELLVLAKPMLLVPLPKAASRGDQLDNAEYFKEKNYAKVILQENLNANSLLQAISSLLFNKNKIVSSLKNSGCKNGTEQIYNIILKNIKK